MSICYMWAMSSSICGINIRPMWLENKKKIQEKLYYVTYDPSGTIVGAFLLVLWPFYYFNLELYGKYQKFNGRMSV